MLATRTWIILALLLFGLGAYQTFGTVEIVYSEVYNEDGTVRVSGVTCGTATGVVFTGTFDESVPGAATQEDCRRAARTRLLESGALLALSALFVFVGVRYGKPPPAPIRTELPDLPDMPRQVEGRKPPRNQPTGS